MRQKRLNRHCSTSGVTTGQWSSWCGDTFGKNADSSSCTFLAPRVLLVEASASLALGIANLGLKGIARLLGVAEQHRSVGLVEDRVVDSCVSHTQGTFHHNHLEREETQSRALISLRLDRKAQFSKEKRKIHFQLLLAFARPRRRLSSYIRSWAAAGMFARWFTYSTMLFSIKSTVHPTGDMIKWCGSLIR